MIIHDVEQRSGDWYALRAGKPTASDFSMLLTPTGKPSKSAETYARKLAAEKFAGKPLDEWSGTQWMERGAILEEMAFKFYEFDRDTTLTKVGFITDDAMTIGCSPDRLAGDDGMLELKCLKADNHVDAILHHKSTGFAPNEYLHQVQGQLLITGRAWCDLMFYRPELPPLIIRQTAIPAVQDALRTAIEGVCKMRDEIVETLNKMKG